MSLPKLHVAVLMGGWSSEREVSLRSGEACAKALEGEGYRVTRVDVGRDVANVLAALNPDVAFNALHGPAGEEPIRHTRSALPQVRSSNPRAPRRAPPPHPSPRRVHPRRTPPRLPRSTTLT